MENKIGIVIPAFNAARYIKKCVSSIQRQSFSNWVLVVVDDGSTDNTSEILDRLAASDSRIHIIHQENSGATMARKTGILCEIIQSCSYCTFCDADDYLADDCLEILYNEMVSTNADLVVGWVEKLFYSVRLRSSFKPDCFPQSPTEYDNESILQKLLISYFGISNFPVCLYAKLYRTQDVTKALETVIPVSFFGDDQCITLPIVSQTRKMVIVPDVVYYYRIGGGTSGFKAYMLDDFIALYLFKRQFIERYQMPQDASLFLDIEMINICKDYLSRCAFIGHYSDEDLASVIDLTCDRVVVKDSAHRIASANVYNSDFAGLIAHKETAAIMAEIRKTTFLQKCKRAIKATLLR